MLNTKHELQDVVLASPSWPYRSFPAKSRPLGPADQPWKMHLWCPPCPTLLIRHCCCCHVQKHQTTFGGTAPVANSKCEWKLHGCRYMVFLQTWNSLATRRDLRNQRLQTRPFSFTKSFAPQSLTNLVERCSSCPRLLLSTSSNTCMPHKRESSTWSAR